MTERPQYQPYQPIVKPCPSTPSLRLLVFVLLDECAGHAHTTHELLGDTGLGSTTLDRLLRECVRLGWVTPEKCGAENAYFLTENQRHWLRNWRHTRQLTDLSRPIDYLPRIEEMQGLNRHEEAFLFACKAYNDARDAEMQKDVPEVGITVSGPVLPEFGELEFPVGGAE